MTSNTMIGTGFLWCLLSGVIWASDGTDGVLTQLRADDLTVVQAVV